MTVWIEPLTGLQDDFHQRSVQYGIKIHKFEHSSRVDTSATMCYVSIELAVNDDFIKFVKLLIQQRRLARIVVDELHLLVTAYHYREPMRRICDLFKAETHISLFTGTGPPELIPHLFEITGIDDWEIIRMPTENPNIAYGVNVLDKNEVTQAAVSYILDRVATYTDPADKAMVFCRTCEETDDVAKLLNVLPYHSKIDADERATTFTAWINGTHKIMVSTTILAEGVNLPVRDVVVVGHAYNMISKKQMAARTARNNTKGRAVFFVPKDCPPIRANPSKPFGAEHLIPWAYNREECRRVKDSLFLDGFAVNCISLAGAELCDNCNRSIRKGIPAPPLPIPTPILQAPLGTELKAPTPYRSAVVQNAPPLERYDGRKQARGSSGEAAGGGGGVPGAASAPAMGQKGNRFIPTAQNQNMASTRTASAPPVPRKTLANAPPPDDDDDEPEFHHDHECFPSTDSKNPPQYVKDGLQRWLISVDLPSRNFSFVATPARPQQRQQQNAFASSMQVIPSSTRSAPPQITRMPALAATTTRAPLPGAAIQVRHQVHAGAEKTQKDLMEFICRAFTRLRDGCPSCWARGVRDWDTHTRLTCTEALCTFEDSFWQKWHRSSMKSTKDVCWQCTIPRNNHRWVPDLRLCDDEYILQAALYAFCTHPEDDLDLSQYDSSLQFNDFGAFWSWAGLTVEGKIQNLHERVTPRSARIRVAAVVRTDALILPPGLYIRLTSFSTPFRAPSRTAHALHARLISWLLEAPATPFGVHRMTLAGKDVGMG
ncbi:P-loop containing nucleoside triphosphate hydrolase protein [Mycena sanguinolenta]|nr:P-loop containing nucleoside triphosphate hydrolase protein [Mycena sanguinolenta]